MVSNHKDIPSVVQYFYAHDMETEYEKQKSTE